MVTRWTSKYLVIDGLKSLHSYSSCITCKGSCRTFLILMSLLGNLDSLKKTHTCYRHQIWTAKIKSVKEWPGKARTSLYQQSSSEYVRWLVINFNAKRLCCVNNRPLHILLIFFFIIYLLIKDHVKHQRRSFLQHQKAANQGWFYPLMVPISNNALF